MSGDNKAVLTRLIEEVWNKGNLKAVGECTSDTLVYHNPLLPEPVKGIEGYRNLAAAVRAAYPDIHFRVEDVIAEGDKVVGRWTATGTNRGEFRGIAPTGRKMKLTGITIVRFAGGKQAEVWVNQDDLGWMHQLGVVTKPAVAEANKAVVGRYIEEVGNQGNFALIMELFSDDCLHHGPCHPELKGREAWKEHFASFRRAFPDLQYVVDELVGEADKVVVRLSVTGTHRGEFWGIPSTGKKISISGTTTFRLAGGIITDEFIQADFLGFMQQLGVVSLPPSN